VLDPATREWADGMLSNIFRDVNKPLLPGKDERRYIVFDGDVDAVWVENMNSVLPKRATFTFQPSLKPSTFNHHPSTFNPQLSTFTPQLSTFNPRPSTFTS